MVERLMKARRDVIDFVRSRQDRIIGKALAGAPRICRHCGAALMDAENEDACASAFNAGAPILRETSRRIYAD